MPACSMVQRSPRRLRWKANRPSWSAARIPPDQAAVHLARFASHVTLLVRGPSLSERMSAYLINELERASNISVWLNTTVSGVYGQGRLEAITVRDSTTGQNALRRRSSVRLDRGRPTLGMACRRVERDARGFLLTGSDLVTGRSTARRCPGNQHSRCLCCRRRTSWIGEARCLSRR